MKTRSLLFLLCALALLSGVRPLYSTTLIYYLSGVVQNVDRDTPSSLVGAPAVMILSYDTDSWAERYPYSNTANMSMLASGMVAVEGRTLSSFSAILLYELDFHLGDHIVLEAAAGYGVLLDGNVTINLSSFPQFQPNGHLFAGTQFAGAVGTGGVLFSSLGVPANTNNQLVGIAWNTITLIPEPTAAALCAGAAGLTLLRRRKHRAL